MKKTLLELVQSILSSMDSDEVNSINDTVESLQIAGIVRDSYYTLVDRANLAEHYKLFELNASSSSTPTLMTPPSYTNNLLWIKYNEMGLTDTIPEFKDIKPLEVDEFFEMTYNYDKDASYFDNYTYTLGSDSIDIFLYNDRAPSYYTVLQDNTILFDSYDVSVETNLQKTKTLCYGQILPTFSMTDAAVPDMDANMFILLENEAKRQAFIELKQTANPVAEQRSRRGWVRSQKNKENLKTASYYTRLPNYARK